MRESVRASALVVEISAKVFSSTFSIEHKDVCLRSDAECRFTIANI